MSRTFAIYGHPKRQEIETAVLAGESCVAIAKKYGLSSSSVDRYKRKILKSQLKLAEIKNIDEIMERLNDYLDLAEQGMESLQEMLEDPERPGLLTLAPHAGDIDVIFLAPEGEKMVKKKASLQKLLNMVNEHYPALETKYTGRDPRELLVKYMEVASKQLELLAKAKGDIVDTKVEVRAVTASASEIADKIRVALKPYPGAIEAVSDILCPKVLPFDEEDTDD